MSTEPTLCRPFVLRMAGLPFSLLGELTEPVAGEPARRLLAAERAQRTLLEGLDGAAVEAAIPPGPERRLLRAARRGDPIQIERIAAVNDAGVRDLFTRIAAGWDELRVLQEKYQDAYGAALAEGRRKLFRAFAEDERLRAVLHVLNPGAYPAMECWLGSMPPDPGQWRAKDRPKLDAFTLYLQRACAKNDSTGVAGPMAVGTFDRSAEDTRAEDAPLRHHVLMTRWAAEAIIDRLAQTTDLAAVTPPRREPGLRVVRCADGRVWADLLRIDYAPFADVRALIGPRERHPLTDAEARLLDLVDGERTPAELAGLVPGVDAALDRLAGLGLIRRTPEIPYGVEDPLPTLRRLAEAIGSAEAAALVNECAEHIDRIAVTALAGRRTALRDLNQAFTERVGEPATRGAGGFYEDRAVVSEDAVGRFTSLVAGRGLVERVERALPLITDTYMFVTRIRAGLVHDVLADWFAGRFPGGASVNAYLRAFADDQEALAPAFERVRREAAAWTERLKNVAVRASAAGDEASLRAFLAEHTPPTPIVCNVDLMLAGAPGAAHIAEPTRLVVGEVHSDEEMLTHGVFAPFVHDLHPDHPEAVTAGYRSLLAADETLMDATVVHLDKCFARRPLDCPDIEACGPSPVPPPQRRQLADLRVELEGGRLRLIECSTGRSVRLVTPPFSWMRLAINPMSVFGFPSRGPGNLFDLGSREHLPEVAFGEVLLSRRAWSTGTEGLKAKDRADGFLAVQRLRDELGLPRHVFARIPGEGKPIYVDLDSPLLVRQLCRFACRVDTVGFSAMDPGPDELWARGADGAYTSELRFTVFDARGVDGRR